MMRKSKGRGRPRKDQFYANVPHEGIVDSPSNEAEAQDHPSMIYVLELRHAEPVILQAIFKILKSLGIKNVRFRFEKTHFKIYAKNARGSNEVFVELPGEKMLSYYCAEVFEIDVSAVTFGRILRILQPFSLITIRTNQQFRTSNLEIILRDHESGAETKYSIDADNLQNYDWEIEKKLAAEHSYPLNFHMNFQNFKKVVTDYRNMGDVLLIEKNGLDPVMFISNFRDKKGIQTTTYYDSGKIGLFSTVAADEIFSTSVCLGDLSFISASTVADLVHISADSHRNLIFTIYLGREPHPEINGEKIPHSERATVKIYTNIVRLVENSSADKAS